MEKPATTGGHHTPSEPGQQSHPPHDTVRNDPDPSGGSGLNEVGEQDFDIYAQECVRRHRAAWADLSQLLTSDVAL